MSSSALCIKPVSQSEFIRQQKQPLSIKTCLDSLSLSGDSALFYKRFLAIIPLVLINTQHVYTGSRTEGDVAIQKTKITADANENRGKVFKIERIPKERGHLHTPLP